jgi:hypothetical protein
MSGATAGVDYSALSGSVTFAADSTISSKVDVSALANNDNDALLTMTVSGDGSLYSTGASDSIHLWGGVADQRSLLVDECAVISTGGRISRA